MAQHVIIIIIRKNKQLLNHTFLHFFHPHSRQNTGVTAIRLQTAIRLTWGIKSQSLVSLVIFRRLQVKMSAVKKLLCRLQHFVCTAWKIQLHVASATMKCTEDIRPALLQSLLANNWLFLFLIPELFLGHINISDKFQHDFRVVVEHSADIDDFDFSPSTLQLF